MKATEERLEAAWAYEATANQAEVVISTIHVEMFASQTCINKLKSKL